MRAPIIALRMSIPFASDFQGDRPPSIEREWAERIRAGDEEAFGAFFREYYRRVVTYVAGSIGDTDVAEEVAQNVFVA